ncbi:hypothetical protein [Isoptericola sp. BMS4]|uniref:hypothetical protein n=1 Tax=Isoptericola sp. BMS4 TaxID=2527875 RepID=UPI0014207870|nr:hypothetical protein [Isoptericola sp. BMS4]
MFARARLATAVRLPAAIAVTGVLAAGCTGGEQDDGQGGDATQSTQSTGSAPAADADPAVGTADAGDGEMATRSTATPHGSGDAWGGEVTTTLRSVEVADGTMTVRWALRWDDDEAPADAGASYYDMGLEPVTTVTDRESLTLYRPFCTDGAWQPETERASDAGLEQLRCRESMLVSPLEKIQFAFPNHGTVESWAVLPAPEGNPEKVDVAPVEGLPMFTDATVTYADGGAE